MLSKAYRRNLKRYPYASAHRTAPQRILPYRNKNATLSVIGSPVKALSRPCNYKINSAGCCVRHPSSDLMRFWALSNRRQFRPSHPWTGHGWRYLIAGYPRLIDFGYGKQIPYPATGTDGIMAMHVRSRTLVGTAEYLAPELVSGKGHDASVDLWALGVRMAFSTLHFARCCSCWWFFFRT